MVIKPLDPEPDLKPDPDSDPELLEMLDPMNQDPQHCSLKGLDAICGGKTALFCRIIKQVRSCAVRQINPLYRGIFSSQKPWFFVHFTESNSDPDPGFHSNVEATLQGFPK